MGASCFRLQKCGCVTTRMKVAMCQLYMDSSKVYQSIHPKDTKQEVLQNATPQN